MADKWQTLSLQSNLKRSSMSLIHEIFHLVRKSEGFFMLGSLLTKDLWLLVGKLVIYSKCFHVLQLYTSTVLNLRGKCSFYSTPFI